MKVTSCSCLLTLFLHCTVDAEIIHEVLEERQSVTLRCSHSVEGKVTWSRETDGNKTDLLTSDGDRLIKHIKDPYKRYSSLADHSLYIRGVKLSDTGRYFCDNEAAVELTVIPSGTVIQTAAERTSVFLTCPHDVGGSHVPTWSRNFGEIQQQPVNKMLIITDVKLSDSGLYSCDGKPAVYLNVTKGDQTDREGQNTPSTTSRAPTSLSSLSSSSSSSSGATTGSTTIKMAPKDQNTPLVLVLGVVVPCLLLLLIIIVYFTWRWKFKRRGTGDRLYDNIQDEFSSYHLAEFTDGSNQNDATYSTITYHTLMENSAGPSTDNTNSYLQNPKEAAQNTDPHL